MSLLNLLVLDSAKVRSGEVLEVLGGGRYRVRSGGRESTVTSSLAESFAAGDVLAFSEINGRRVVLGRDTARRFARREVRIDG